MIKTNSINEILLVTDMDGTLINSPQPVSKKNLDSIKKFTSMGGKFTLATGRSIESARGFLSEVEITAPAILVNGGIIYDYEKEKIIYQEVLPDTAIDIVKDIKKNFPQIGIEVVVGHDVYNLGRNEMTYRRVSQEKMKYKYAPIDHMPKGWNKVLFATGEELQPFLIEYVRQNHYDGVYFIPTSKIYFELVPELSTKGNALIKLADYLDIDIENTCAIGDYYNDISMLDDAEYSASPMDALEDVKKHADIVVRSSHDGAVADFIDRILDSAVKG